jgi:hypothetical protein
VVASPRMVVVAAGWPAGAVAVPAGAPGGSEARPTALPADAPAEDPSSGSDATTAPRSAARIETTLAEPLPPSDGPTSRPEELPEELSDAVVVALAGCPTAALVGVLERPLHGAAGATGRRLDVDAVLRAVVGPVGPLPVHRWYRPDGGAPPVAVPADAVGQARAVWDAVHARGPVVLVEPTDEVARDRDPWVLDPGDDGSQQASDDRFSDDLSVEALAALPSLRRGPARRRAWERCATEVVLTGQVDDVGAVRRTLVSLLRVGDVRVRLDRPAPPGVDDPRVTVGPWPDDRDVPAALLAVEAGVLVDAEALDRVARLASTHGVGAVRVAWPGPGGGRARLTWLRAPWAAARLLPDAPGRALRDGRPDGATLDDVTRRTGVWWLPADRSGLPATAPDPGSVGIGSAGAVTVVPDPALLDAVHALQANAIAHADAAQRAAARVTELETTLAATRAELRRAAPGGGAAGTAEPPDAADELAATRRDLEALRRRRVVRLADAVGRGLRRLRR